MKYTLIVALMLVSFSCSDNIRNNPLDPASNNTIIGSLSGKILPANSSPSLQLKNGSELISTTTVPSDGYFEFKNLKEASYTITIKAANYNDLMINDVTVVGRKNTDIGNLVLTPTTSAGDTSSPRAIFGKVLDTKNQGPILGVLVTATGTRTYNTQTNASGTYSILNVDSGQYNVTATKDGFLISTTTVKVNRSGGVEANFSLGAIGIIQGKVTDGQNNNPLANVLVKIEGFSSYTNSNGEYVISGIQDPITTSVSFSLSQYVTYAKAVDVVPGSISVLDVKLSKYGTIVGKVSEASNGAAISGISIASNYSATTSDGNGNYSVNAIPGSVTLKINGNGYVQKEISGINVTAGNTTIQNMSLQSQTTAPLANVNGVIKDLLTGNRPSLLTTSDLSIYLYDLRKYTFFGYGVDSIRNGQYTLRNIEYSTPRYPGNNFLQGDYLLVAAGPYLTKNGYLPVEKYITLSAGTNIINIDLIKGATVVGVVSNSIDNTAVVNASVSIGSQMGSTDNSGAYRLYPVDPMLNSLSITAAGFYSSNEKVSLQSNQTSYVAVSMTPLPIISGAVVDSATGAGLGDVRIEMGNCVSITNSGGSYVLPNLLEGTKVLSFAKQGYKSYVTSVTVPHSGTVSVNATLSKYR
ncbi:MAG: carboxypeptidase regulatory-like domain-containing protein [Ignavibacteriales bacterium]|nr:carboxypeptidase regulatory-like domain-containing protein [Ignavibacteriales bacterium]